MKATRKLIIEKALASKKHTVTVYEEQGFTEIVWENGQMAVKPTLQIPNKGRMVAYEQFPWPKFNLTIQEFADYIALDLGIRPLKKLTFITRQGVVVDIDPITVVTYEEAFLEARKIMKVMGWASDSYETGWYPIKETEDGNFTFRVVI